MPAASYANPGCFPASPKAATLQAMLKGFGATQAALVIICLRSNEIAWGAGKLWRTYMTLTDVEVIFRNSASACGRCFTTPNNTPRDIRSSQFWRVNWFRPFVSV